MQMKTSKLPHLEERKGRAELFPLVAFDVVGLFLLSNWFAIGALWESMTSDAKAICGFPIFFLFLRKLQGTKDLSRIPSRDWLR